MKIAVGGWVELAKNLAEHHEVTIVEKENLAYRTKPTMSHYIMEDGSRPSTKTERSSKSGSSKT